MAVDTKPKRFSMLNFGGESLLMIDPSGSVATQDRLHFLDLYSGIAAGAPVAAATLSDISPLGISNFQTPALGTSNFQTPWLGISEFTTPETGGTDL